MMEVTLTCSECGSGIHIHPSKEASVAKCTICEHEMPVKFNEDHEKGSLVDCPCCERKDFYSQKDFNRKIGVGLFIFASLCSLFMVTTQYAMWSVAPFLVLYVFDLVLFRRLKKIAICYKCTSIFRNVSNIDNIEGFNHEMNDRIVYSDHDFGGKPLSH